MNPVGLILFLVAFTQDVPVGGPLTDALERRLDKFAERVEAWQSGSTVLLKRIEEMQASRFTELLQEVRLIRNERDGILSEIAEFREQREGLLSKLQSLADDVRKNREENGTLAQRVIAGAREACESVSKAWYPGKFLWGLAFGLGALAVAIVVIGSVLLYFVLKVKKLLGV